MAIISLLWLAPGCPGGVHAAVASIRLSSKFNLYIGFKYIEKASRTRWYCLDKRFSQFSLPRFFADGSGCGRYRSD